MAPDTQEKSSTGLDANIAAALSYLLGFITGVLFLVLEKDSKFVRFHAMQSTITWVAVFVLNFVLGATVVGILVTFLLFPLELILWVLLMYKAFQGEKFKLPIVGDMAEKQVYGASA